MADQDFVSKVSLTEAQQQKATPLEPSFEHLLHDAKVDASTIWALRHCQIADRETFAALEDSVEGLKSLALDLADGGMPHKREFARITTAWKKARAQAEIKVSTEALQKQHGEPVAMLPEDWTSVIVQFKKNTVQSFKMTSCPRSSTTRNFRTGCLLACSEPKRWIRRSAWRSKKSKNVSSRTRQSSSEFISTPSSRCKLGDALRVQPEEHRGTPSEIRDHEQHVAPGSAPAARAVTVLRLIAYNFPSYLEAASWQGRLRSEKGDPRQVLDRAILGTLLVV